MRFLDDMGVAMRVVEWFRDEGHDARHLRAEGLHRLPDGEIFAKAAAERWILLTFDLDFGEIVALSRDRSVSIILFRFHNTRTPHVIERLQHVLKRSRRALEQGAIIVIEESRYRVRQTPLGG